MKLLLDQNLSHRLLALFDDLFPASVHIRALGLAEADDLAIWNCAKDHTRISCAALLPKSSGCGAAMPRWIKSTHENRMDTSVLVAAARSNQGASHALVQRLPDPAFTICLSVALYHEWQAVLSRPENLPPGQTAADALGFVRYLASIAHLQDIHFLWRPFLPDPDDDMVLELAFAAGASRIVTHNLRNLHGCVGLGIAVISPSQFIQLIP